MVIVRILQAVSTWDGLGNSARALVPKVSGSATCQENLGLY